ncbi:MAG: helix-turn-helix domain-containing protein [Phycisphaerales bacterium]|nr:helix-turn-helix domain-containing protein [Phycisphaerales bacterium]
MARTWVERGDVPRDATRVRSTLHATQSDRLPQARDRLPQAHHDRRLHLLRIPEAAAKLAVCPRTVQSAIARGDLRVVRLGRAVRIDPADLRAYIWTCRSAAPGGGR